MSSTDTPTPTRPTAAATAAQIIALFTTPVVPQLADGEPTDDTVSRWISQALTRRHDLSSGEKVLLDLVRTAWNGTGDVMVRDLRSIDTTLRRQVLTILTDAWT